MCYCMDSVALLLRPSSGTLRYREARGKAPDAAPRVEADSWSQRPGRESSSSCRRNGLLDWFLSLANLALLLWADAKAVTHPPRPTPKCLTSCEG